ncbi:MAG: hypothetical protein IKA71_02305 [Lentisphaeria bacterium]|nr:hypothetical protein [Lentisphaeria bacterium]
MKNKSFVFIFVGVVLVLLCGCVSAVQNSKNSESGKVLEIAMGERLIVAFQKQDVKAFYKEVPPEVQSVWGTKEFEFECKKLKERWGEIDSFRYLTELEMSPTHQHVWAVRFKHRNLKGEFVYREVLFVVLTGTIDGNPKVFLFGFK